jgi:hypothetical protein
MGAKKDPERAVAGKATSEKITTALHWIVRQSIAD